MEHVGKATTEKPPFLPAIVGELRKISAGLNEVNGVTFMRINSIRPFPKESEDVCKADVKREPQSIEDELQELCESLNKQVAFINRMNLHFSTIV